MQHLRDDVLSAPAGLERLYTLPHEFSDAWFAFRSAEDDADRIHALSVDQSSFPYWVSRLGMDDALDATFAVVDLDRARLSLAPAAVALDGDARAGWTLTVDQASPVFAFLNRHSEDTVHMTVAYAAAG